MRTQQLDIQTEALKASLRDIRFKIAQKQFKVKNLFNRWVDGTPDHIKTIKRIIDAMVNDNADSIFNTYNQVISILAHLKKSSRRHPETMQFYQDNLQKLQASYQHKSSEKLLLPPPTYQQSMVNRLIDVHSVISSGVSNVVNPTVTSSLYPHLTGMTSYSSHPATLLASKKFSTPIIPPPPPSVTSVTTATVVPIQKFIEEKANGKNANKTTELTMPVPVEFDIDFAFVNQFPPVPDHPLVSGEPERIKIGMYSM